jgi:HEAT repeat protein
MTGRTSRLPLLIAAAAGGMVASAAAGETRVVASPAVIEALSAVDFLPSSAALSTMLAGDLQTLVDLADSDADPGVRLRAYRSLGMFDSDVARNALAATIARLSGASTGTETLFLLAAIEGYGQIGGAGGVRLLVPLLDAPELDVRAATARALGATRAPAACAPLHDRGANEASEQVRIAIDAAIAAACR